MVRSYGASDEEAVAPASFDVAHCHRFPRIVSVAVQYYLKPMKFSTCYTEGLAKSVYWLTGGLPCTMKTDLPPAVPLPQASASRSRLRGITANEARMSKLQLPTLKVLD